MNDIIYKYDIPVGCPPKIPSPRDDCRSRDVIFVLLCQTKYKTQKGEKLQTPEILDRCLVELVSPVRHSANSMGVNGYSSG